MKSLPLATRILTLSVLMFARGHAAETSPSAVAAADRSQHRTVFDVRDFGAIGDGVTFDTPALQAAIDACAEAKGGTVLVAGGTFLSRTIYLKSNVNLRIEAGAVLQGSNRLEDYALVYPEYKTYTYSYRALVYAEKADNVSITGKGAIDLQGRDFPPMKKGTPGQMEWGASPFAVRLVQCRNLTVRDVTVRNCPMVGLRIVGCHDVLVDGVVIDNRVRISCDGIEIVSSQQVAVSNCRVFSWDDGICVKSASDDLCKNIAITNCTISSLCNAIKLGTESNGGFENIVISNCTIEGGEMDGWRSINGLALEIVDGGRMNQVIVSNLVMRKVRTAIFVHLGDRGRGFLPNAAKPPIGTLKNVTITNVFAEAVDAKIACSISGLPGHPVENIVLENIRLRVPGGGSLAESTRVVPELPQDYPESLMFGALPASGFYCRHATNLTFRNVVVESDQPDERPAFIFDDVAGLEVAGVAAPAATRLLVQLRNVENGTLHRNFLRQPVHSFVEVSGERSKEILLMGNDLRRSQLPVTFADGAAPSVVTQSMNLSP
ncbi:MAG: glycoside hydrolase family 28 protein [Opitutus sp.]